MTRFFLGAALLLSVAADRCPADFISIKLDLNQFAPGKVVTRTGPKGPIQPPPIPDKGPKLPPIWVYANMQLKKKVEIKGPYAILEHEWGTTTVPGNMPKGSLEFTDRQVDPLKKRYADQVKRVTKAGTEKLRLLILAEWALKHGLTGEFEKKMNDLVVLDASQPAAAAFQKVSKEMKNGAVGDDPAATAIVEDLKAEGYHAAPSQRGHYVLYTRLPAEDPLVKRRLDRLEETFANFFYWFALKGKALTVPKYRLVAVLEGDRKSFDQRHAAYDSVPMVADGFTIRRDNVVVMYAKRLDDAYALLEKNNQTIWRDLKIKKDELFGYSIPTRALFNPADVPVLQTLALVQRVMEDESERSTVTHEGTRQLLAAAGLLPRNVAAGEWVRYGLASLLETPHGAFYPGSGLPSWTNLIAFKHLRKTGRLSEERSKEMLLNVITDRYFQVAYGLAAETAEGSESREVLAPRAREALEMARATSWALMYHLMTQDGYTEASKDVKSDNLERLLRYLEELRSLPRDVEYDASVLRGCFGRAAGMLKADASDPTALDMEKLSRLAQGCFSTMENTVLEVRGVEEEMLRERSQPSRKGRPAP